MSRRDVLRYGVSLAVTSALSETGMTALASNDKAVFLAPQTVKPNIVFLLMDLDQRRLIDAEITRRTIDFMKRSVQGGTPFYVYVPFTLVHFPALPKPKFPGKTLPGRERLTTVQILPGPWRGYYFTHMEGSLRAPFIIRWPSKIPADRVTNEIVHEVDIFTTFAKIAKAAIPQDRPVDGVDQTDFLFGKPKSNRDGFPVFVADRLEAVKWRNYKLAFYEAQRDWWSPAIKLGVPQIFDLYTDPREEYPVTLAPNGWVAFPMMKIVADFEASLKKYPPIAPGTLDPYTPLRTE